MKATAQESSRLFPLCSVVAWRLSVAPGYCGGVYNVALGGGTAMCSRSGSGRRVAPARIVIC